MIKGLKRLRNDSGTFAEKYTPQDINRVHALRDQGLTFSQISSQTGLTQTQVRYVIYYKHPSTTSPTHHSSQSTTSTDGTVTQVGYRTLKAGLSKQTDADVLKAHGLDPRKFTLTSVTDNYWGRDNATGEPLYQTKIKAEPKEIDLDTIISTLQEEVEPLPSIDVNTGTASNKRLLVIPLFDLHFGIATYDTYRPYLEKIEHRIASERYSAILVILGGDIFHSDSMTKSVTAKGTQLDHVNMTQAVDDATKFTRELLDFSLEHADTLGVSSIPGNHDQDIGYVWATGLQQLYANRIELFGVTTNTYDAMNFGNVGILAAHGDVAKSRLPMLFANDAKEIWSQTSYHAIFSGHFHKEVTTDESGVVCYQVGTPKPADNWEKRNGLIMSRRKLELFDFSDTTLNAIYYIENN